MPKNRLGDRACWNRLTKYIEKTYTEEEREVIAYYNDVITHFDYSFIYDLPNGNKMRLSIDRATHKIEEVQIQ